jgi:type IV pilus assembly protein PilB
MAIHELMIVNDDVRNGIIAGKTSTEIKEIARTQGGMRTLLMDGIEKAMQGLTSLEEISGSVSSE